MKLPSVGFHPIDEALVPEDISVLPRAPRRIMEVLKKGSKVSALAAPKSWSLDFCLSPISFNPHETSPSQLDSVTFEKTSLMSGRFDPAVRAEGTGQIDNIPTSTAFRSIGYKSESLPGFAELGIPFDDRQGIIPNDQFGRIVSRDQTVSEAPVARQLPGLYCAGWVKRGPTGVIASTMQDAFSTADAIADDWYSHVPFLNTGSGGSGLGWDGVKDYAEKTNCRRVSWSGWQKIDAVEKGIGQAKGKEREKFTRIEDMLAVLD